MKELQNEIWNKAIQERFEEQTEMLITLSRLRKLEEMTKENEQIKKAKEEIEKLSTEELAEILVALENKTKKQEKIIKNLEESLQSLEKIRDIIISEYGIDEY